MVDNRKHNPAHFLHHLKNRPLMYSLPSLVELVVSGRLLVTHELRHVNFDHDLRINAVMVWNLVFCSARHLHVRYRLDKARCWVWHGCILFADLMIEFSG